MEAQDYEKLVKALRYCPKTEGMVYCNVNCKYGWEERSEGCKDLLMTDAADAIEALDRLLDQNTQRCEALRKQLREAHESYERHLNELEAQLPKRDEIVQCKDCIYFYFGFCHNRNGYVKFGACDDRDWFCGDGKMEAQDADK